MVDDTSPVSVNVVLRWSSDIYILKAYYHLRAEDFCNVHRELQGIQYPANPTKLTYDEMNTCLNVANETEIYSHVQYCANETCVVSNIPSKEPKCDSSICRQLKSTDFESIYFF